MKQIHLPDWPFFHKRLSGSDEKLLHYLSGKDTDSPSTPNRLPTRHSIACLWEGSKKHPPYTRSKKVISIEVPFEQSFLFQRSNRRFTITGYRLIDSRRRHLSTYSVTYNGDIVSICHIVVHIAADRKIMFVGKHLIVGNTYIEETFVVTFFVFRQFTEFFPQEIRSYAPE